VQYVLAEDIGLRLAFTVCGEFAWLFNIVFAKIENEFFLLNCG